MRIGGHSALIAAAAIGSLVLAGCGGSEPRDTLAVLGDSLTAPVGDAQQADADWLAHADPDKRFELVANAGIPGQRSDEILARVDSDVIARSPAWCTVLAGTNDVSQDVDAMTIIANLMRIYDALEQAGIGIIAITIPPKVMLSPTQADNQRAVNAWMREHVEADWPGAVLADWSGELSQDGDEVEPVAEYFHDGTHFSATGAQVAGRAIRDELAEAADADPLEAGAGG
jgi:lysophospholipase L1-like esterase